MYINVYIRAGIKRALPSRAQRLKVAPQDITNVARKVMSQRWRLMNQPTANMKYPLQGGLSPSGISWK